MLRPASFGAEGKEVNDQMIPNDMLPPSDDSDFDDDQHMMVNPNRPLITQEDESNTSEDESEEEACGKNHPSPKA